MKRKEITLTRFTVGCLVHEMARDESFALKYFTDLLQYMDGYGHCPRHPINYKWPDFGIDKRDKLTDQYEIEEDVVEKHHK